MFPCACSLRSTQCAALIALATATGISRFEVPIAAPSMARTQTVNAAGSSLVRGRAAVFYHVLWTLAPWLARDARIQRAMGPTFRSSAFPDPSPEAGHLVSNVASNISAASLAGIPISAVDHVEAFLLRYPFRQHALPFALGPPRIGIRAIDRVVVTSVTGDSAALSQSPEEFATDAFNALSWFTRERVPVPELTGPALSAEFRPARRTGDIKTASTISLSAADLGLSSAHGTRSPAVTCAAISAALTYFRGVERMMRLASPFVAQT